MSTILLVDDDILVQDVTKEMLEFMGHKVLVAENGTKALEIIKSTPKEIELVLLDLSLPDMSGIEMIPYIMDENPKTIIVVCTGGNFEDEDADTLTQSGIRGILQKPFEFEFLKSTLERLLPQK